ncbi:MAG: T9SS type A sorting domain-containing protein [Bacteroidota bacterium]
MVVNPSTAIASQSTATQTVCINGSFSAISVSANGVGLTYQWYSNTTASTTGGTLISGATNNTYTPDATVAGTTYYYAIVNGTCGTTTSSVSGAMVVNPNNTISLTSTNGTDNQTVCVTNAITSITYSTTGATGATISGLPAGINGSWSNDVVTISGTSSVSGTFNYTVTLSGGCGTTSTTGTIIITPALAVTGTVVNVGCNGASTGSVSLSVTGGTTPYTYSWSSGQTTQNISNLPAGVYSVSVTCATGCLATSTYSITEPIVLSASISAQSNVSCNAGNNGSATVIASGGTGAYIYTWNTSPVQTTATAIGLTAGSYTVTITDANGCTTTSSVTINQPSAPLTQTVIVTDVLCYGEFTGSVNITVNGGTTPYTYLWNNSETTEDLSNLEAGTYDVIITDNNGCFSTETVTISQPNSSLIASSTQTNVLCYGGSNGSIDVTTSGGTSPYAYSWDNSATSEDISNLLAGSYSLLITDANNCTYTLNASISQPTILNATASSGIILCNGSTTTVTVTATGGVPSYSNTGTYTVSAGAYTYTVTDANGCSDTANVIVNQNSGVSSTATITSVSCYGGNDGAVNITPSGGVGPYSFSWSNSVTTEDISGLLSGTYSVEIKDANGCTGNSTYTVNQPAPLSLSTNVGNVNCFGSASGSIFLTVVGGTGSKTYSWSNGSSNQNLINVPAGSYSVTVTDSKGCTATTSVTVTQNPAIVVTPTITPVTCNGFANGAISVSVTGGVSPYTYTWSNGAGNQSSISNLAAANYNLTVTDNLGCNKVQIYTVTQPAPLSVSLVSVTGAQCSGSSTGSADVSVSGGTPSYTYSWSNGATTQDLVNVPAGSYTLTVTDTKSCVNTIIATITTAPSLVATATATPISCFGGTSIVTVSATGGTPGYTGTGTYTVTAGTYDYTVTCSAGCTSVANVTVSEPTLLDATTTTQSVTCNGQSTGSATVTPSGGTLPYSYSWSNGSTANSTGNVTAGNYIVTVTDANSCIVTKTVTISQSQPITLNTVNSNPLCFGGSSGSIDLTVNGGTPPFTYQWSAPGNQTTEDLSNLPVGTYSVLVTDNNGCTQSTSVILTQPTQIAITASVTNSTCGNSDGAINLTVNGGTGSYTYSWSNSSTLEDQVSLVGGNYSVSVTDANSCLAAQTYTVGVTGGTISSISGPVIVCDFVPPGPSSNLLAKYTANISCGTPTGYQWLIPTSNNTFNVVGATNTQDLQIQYLNGFDQATFTVNVYFGSVTVTQTITTSAAPLPPNVTGSVCGSVAANNTYSVVPSYSGVTYNWTAPFGTSILSGQGTSVMVLKFSSYYTGGQLEITADNLCGTSDPTIITLLKSPDKPTSITGTTPFCIGSQIPNGIPFTCTQVPTATYYFWNAPNGASVITGQMSSTANILFNSSFISGNISVQAGNQCGTSSMTYLTVSSQTISPSGPISGPTNVCQYLGSGTATYSVAPVSGVTTYNWTAPAGATIVSGQGTNTVGLSFNTSFVTGNLSLVVGGFCGFSSPTNLALSLTNIFPVGTISGPTNVCNNISQGSTATYSVAIVPGASNYTWSVPFGATITSGQGTNVIQVTYSGSFNSGPVTVSVASYCGTGSTSSSLSVNKIPSSAGNIFGVTCINIGNVSTYSVNPVAGVTNYNWTVPSGSSIQSGQGTNSISVLFGSNFSPGNITVTPTNSCGSGSTSSIALNIVATAPTQISGPQVVCSNIGTGTVTYTASAVSGATSYQWGQVNGMNIISGQGTATLTVTFNTTFISGNLSCMSITPCGSSPMTYYSISKKPQFTNPISGITNVCSFVGTTSTVTYSTSPIAGVSIYNWTVSNPGLMQIISGQNSASITVKYLAGFTSGTISCIATSACGNSPSSANLSVSCPTPIANNSTESVIKFDNISSKPISGDGMQDGSVQWTISSVTEPVTYYLNDAEISVVSASGYEGLINGLTSGNYTLKAVDADGKLASVQFEITNSVRAISNHSIFEIKVYPVPANNELSIELPSPSTSEFVLRVMSVEGKLVHAGNISPQGLKVIKLNTSLWDNGTYFIQLMDVNNGIRSLKEIIVQH